jgi:hypothetical protein
LAEHVPGALPKGAALPHFPCRYTKEDRRTAPIPWHVCVLAPCADALWDGLGETVVNELRRVRATHADVTTRTDSIFDLWQICGPGCGPLMGMYGVLWRCMTLLRSFTHASVISSDFGDSQGKGPSIRFRLPVVDDPRSQRVIQVLLANNANCHSDFSK